MDTPTEFRTEQFSRRGEWTAWALGILGLLGWITLSIRGIEIPFLFALLTVFLLLAALAISLSNWSDRRTLIKLEANGIQFENGLRRVHLRWDEIQKVQIFTTNLGDQVRVTGERTFFSFRLLGEVSLRGQVRGRVGFAGGDIILCHILENAKLTRIEQPGKGYYYARE